MRKLLNTLYITQEDVYLKLDGLNIVISKGSNIIARVPFCNIENIVCFNYLGCSPMLMAQCAEQGVGLSFLKPSGEFLARVSGKIKGNVHLRVKQFESLQDSGKCLYLTKQSILAKTLNSKNYLLKQTRENLALKSILEGIISRIGEEIKSIQNADNIDTIRGFEGTIARDYFGSFSKIIKGDFVFDFRNKRPPLDPVNAMLSYLYTLLALDCQSALEVVGLDPYIGYFHTDRAGRASLALDLMEEFRCFLVDRCIISLINLKQIRPEHFKTTSSKAVFMTEEGRNIIIKAWQSRKKEEIMHPIIKEKVQLGLLPYIQAQILAKFLRGETEKYEPFVVKL